MHCADSLCCSFFDGTVLTVFVAVSLMVERSIHRVTNWLKTIERKPLLKALDKMKNLMLLGFMSLLLVATSRVISNICIPSRFYTGAFTPCSMSEIVEEDENGSSEDRHVSMASDFHSFPRILRDRNTITCKEGHEPFVSYEGLEQLHRFIFIMAITHLAYSCLTMLLTIVKIHRWRAWEEEAHMDQHGFLTAQAREALMRREAAFVVHHKSNPLANNRAVIWVICYFQQFGWSVVRADYLTLRKGFIMNHNLSPKYDFHNYMVRSMEEEFQMIVGISAPLWGFVVVFMLCNVKGSNLYFWIAIIPITLVLLVGAKLQHVMATLTLESAGITGYCSGTLRPRDELFWFKKPEWLLSLIHFILFQNSFELASFFWYWWQFGYNSCFLHNHTFVYLRIILGFAGQFMCSYITLPLYAQITQMGTNFKAALIPQGVRETIHGWGKEARRSRRRRRRRFVNDSAIQTDTSRVLSANDGYHGLIDIHGTRGSTSNGIEMQAAGRATPKQTFSSSLKKTEFLRVEEDGFIGSQILNLFHTRELNNDAYIVQLPV
ncbi:MLO-like protein 14 [Hibiscus syriacus]|uniref:MLO-like protein 14 n=1 Tax=Hibiscus syriacus TaxID=106335 RepID=UPI001922AE23|nr:MLO-like protein 14 [Hibiscus syriacus]